MPLLSESAPLSTNSAKRVSTNRPPSDSVERRCYEDAICVDEYTDRAGVIRFQLLNQKSTELTVTYDLDLVNFAADESLPRTIVIGSNASVPLTTLTQKSRSREASYRFSYRWQWGQANTKHDNAVLYELPVLPGETCRVTQGYDGKFSHNGKNAIDFAMPVGSKIYAARGGEIIATEDGNYPHSDRRAAIEDRNEANYILVKHDDATIGAYFHLDHAGVKVQVGERIEAGDFIALSGNTGYTSGPHLHFEVTSPLDGTEAISYPVLFRTGNAVASIPHGGSILSRPLYHPPTLLDNNLPISNLPGSPIPVS